MRTQIFGVPALGDSVCARARARVSDPKQNSAYYSLWLFHDYVASGD